MAHVINSLFTNEDDLYYFESDHLALKGNKDYSELLKTVVILSALREKAIEDFNKVVEIRKKALEDPIQVLEKIQKGISLGVPPMLELPKLPVINFTKYDVPVSEDDLKQIYADSKSLKAEEDLKNIKQINNNAWTPEEQKRLEELLEVYPPEPIEMRRFHKIAKALDRRDPFPFLVYDYLALPGNIYGEKDFGKTCEHFLKKCCASHIISETIRKLFVYYFFSITHEQIQGNRTVQQVTSRVQKYFLKLYKAGLPIPGRIPKSCEKYKKSVLHKHQRHNHYLWKPTTFFPELYVPVTMNDLDNIPGPSLNSCPTSTSNAGPLNYLLSTEYHKSDTVTNAKKTDPEIQLDLLKRIKMEKLKEQEGNSSLFEHYGYRCDYCDTDPIVGPRWHCTTCTDSVDFCTDCVVSQMYSENPHPLQHPLVIYYNEVQSQSLPLSDSESCAESGTIKNCETDSNYSEEFENTNSFSQFETCDANLENTNDCSNILDLDFSNASKNDDSSNGLDMTHEYE